MTDQPANRKALLDVFATVANDFTGTRNQVAHREETLRSCVAKLETACQASLFKGDGKDTIQGIEDFAERCFESIEPALGRWLASIRRYELNTSFRKDFEDSLLVFVYGKVKAGKSSLGNYLAYGYRDPKPEQLDRATPVPEFFWHVGNESATETMSAQRMQQRRRFGVDVVEATSSIQGFRLPGLTWVDSPGVHSVTEENGRLAADYAACADLIIFLSHSSSPGRRSDMGEVDKLLDQGKPLMVLITGSDEFEEDVDNDGQVVNALVMKSAKNQAEQREHMAKELAKIGVAPGQIQAHSVSVRYAEEGPADEQQRRWVESGMAGFAEHLKRIAGSEGLAMKRQVPLRNLLAFCRELASSIETLRSDLGNVKADLSVARRALKSNVNESLADIRRKLPVEIDRLAALHSMDDEKFAAACGELFDKVYSAQAAELCKSIGQHFETLQIHEHAIGPVAPDAVRFAQRKEKHTFNSKRGEGFGRAGGAAIGGWGGAEAGAALGTLLMPGVGTFLGGLVGGALGGWLGGKGGGAAGGFFNASEEFEVPVGDNRDEVALAARQRWIEHAGHRLEAMYQQLDSRCYGAIVEWLARFDRELVATRDETHKQITEIEKELAHGIA